MEKSFHLHNKKESAASNPVEEDWLDVFLDRLQTLDLKDGMEYSKLIPLSMEVRLINRVDSKLVIVGKFEDIDIGELHETMGDCQKMISLLLFWKHLDLLSVRQCVYNGTYLRLFFC